MSATKSLAQRQADYRAARRAEGLKELRNLWCYPDDEAAVRALTARLKDRRERAEARIRPA